MTAEHPVTHPREADRAPWDRFAWVLGVIWVVFLAFPIMGALRSDAPDAARYTAVGLFAVFGLVYIAAFIWMTNSASWKQARRRALPALSLLAVLMIVATLLAGLEGLGATAFLVSLAMFSGPKRGSVALATAIYAAMAVALLASGQVAEHWMLFVPPALVYITTATVRFVMDAQETHDDMDRQLAVVAERERVARDVHDVLGHSLTVVTVKSELAERLVDLDPEAAKAELAQIRSLSREALAEVRATVAGLRVARLSDELLSARAALVDAGIEADVPADGDVVDPRRRIVVAWTLREAITNVVRHSRATRCVVTLSTNGIAIDDDGIGIPPHEVASGLRGIRERAEAAGATLEVGESARGIGTRIEVAW